MSQFDYEVGGQKFRMKSFGDAINQRFINLSEYFLANRPFNSSAFCREANSYFTNHTGDWTAHNSFFEGFHSYLAGFIKNRPVARRSLGLGTRCEVRN